MIDDVGHILNPTFAPRTCEPSSQTVADSADVSASQTRASYRDILLQRPQPSSPKKKARKAKLAEKAARSFQPISPAHGYQFIHFYARNGKQKKCQRNARSSINLELTLPEL